MCCYYIFECLFTKPKEPVRPALLRKSSYHFTSNMMKISPN